MVNLTLNTDNKIKNVIGSSKCLGSDWSYSNQDSKVLRFEYSFGIHGEKVGQGVFSPITAHVQSLLQKSDLHECF
jgi:hypothetical protein